MRSPQVIWNNKNHLFYDFLSGNEAIEFWKWVMTTLIVLMAHICVGEIQRYRFGEFNIKAGFWSHEDFKFDINGISLDETGFELYRALGFGPKKSRNQTLRGMKLSIGKCRWANCFICGCQKVVTLFILASI